MRLRAGHQIRSRNTTASARTRSGRAARGAPRRWLGALATVALVAGGLVVAAPGTAGAVASLTGSLSGSATQQAGTNWTLTGTVTNNGTTTVTGINTIGSTNRGWIVGSNLTGICNATNYGDDSATGYSILVCAAGGFSLGPSQSVSADVYIDTTGLAGQSITYTGHTNSPDLPGGRTPDGSKTVNVIDPVPTVSITSPIDGHLLDNVNDTTFSADATPAPGASIDVVDFYIDGSLVGGDGDAPFETTIPVGSLSTGPHTLTATVHDSAEGSASDTIDVTQGIAPTIAITSPPANATLDTGNATEFSAAASPSTDATVTSVDFSVDETMVASLSTPLPSTNIYKTSIPPNSLSQGLHVLQVQVNDSHGESATDVITVTQPALVGPTVTIKPPGGFNASYFDSPATFQATTMLQSGDIVQSVSWNVDGNTLSGGSSVKPYSITIDPVTLGPGTHSLNVTVTTNRGGSESTQRFGSDTLVVTVPRATLVLDDLTPGDNTITPLSDRFIPPAAPDPTTDAAWVAPVTNTGDGTARAVALEVAVSDGTNLRSFDLPQMLPGCTPATVFKNPNGTGGISGVRCTLVDIAPGATQYVSVRVPTNGIPDGTQLVGFTRVISSNADVPQTSLLDTTTAIVPQPVRDPDTNEIIAAPEVISIATPTTAQTATIVNTTAPVSAFNQVLIKVATPRKVAAGSLAPLATPLGARAFATLAPAATAATKPVAPPPVAISLSAASATDPRWCPPSGCKGLPSIIGGDFSHYKDKAHPIKVTIATFLPGAVAPNIAKGIVGTVGEFYFTGDNGTYQLTGPTGLGLCAKSKITKQYATPCHSGPPKFTTVLDANKHQTGVIATDVILFVGGDPTGRRH